jgi:hypothetical protein
MAAKGIVKMIYLVAVIIMGVTVAQLNHGANIESFAQIPSPNDTIANNTTNITNAAGTISSIQNDETGKSPTWILSGRWNMMNLTTQPSLEGENQTPQVFNASFAMVKLADGTGKHSHNITDFKLSSASIIKNKLSTFNGTATVTLKDGPHTDVPISIKLLGKRGAISIWIDPTQVNNHFGNTPIYGNMFKFQQS